MKVSAEKTVFSISDEAKFNVTYINDSNHKANATNIELIQIVEKDDAQRIYHLLYSANVEGVEKNSNKMLNINFKIPELLPTIDQFCKCFKISHEIHITALMSGIAFDHRVKVPVFIGLNSRSN